MALSYCRSLSSEAHTVAAIQSLPRAAQRNGRASGKPMLPPSVWSPAASCGVRGIRGESGEHLPSLFALRAHRRPQGLILGSREAKPETSRAEAPPRHNEL